MKVLILEVKSCSKAFFNIPERSLENSLFTQRASLKASFVRLTILSIKYQEEKMSVFGLVNVDESNGVCILL